MEGSINAPHLQGGWLVGADFLTLIVGGMNDHSPPCNKNRQGFAAFPIMGAAGDGMSRFVMGDGWLPTGMVARLINHPVVEATNY
ncbi:hypothetical protein [Streptomyces erythrochromogenes]|uniref:hypothetical protein n=1 Tax=Streptomyces erythrochromogenes TaxID=285574 RepID=UPI0038193D93